MRFSQKGLMMKLDHTSDEDMLPANHLDPPEMNDLPPAKQPTLLIEGRTYEIESWSEAEEDGSRKATLREIAPF
jgi:hypothetical protein